jgi:hypothetical protein
MDQSFTQTLLAGMNMLQNAFQMATENNMRRQRMDLEQQEFNSLKAAREARVVEQEKTLKLKEEQFQLEQQKAVAAEANAVGALAERGRANDIAQNRLDFEQTKLNATTHDTLADAKKEETELSSYLASQPTPYQVAKGLDLDGTVKALARAKHDRLMIPGDVQMMHDVALKKGEIGNQMIRGLDKDITDLQNAIDIRLQQRDSYVNQLPAERAAKLGKLGTTLPSPTPQVPGTTKVSVSAPAGEGMDAARENARSSLRQIATGAAAGDWANNPQQRANLKSAMTTFFQTFPKGDTMSGIDMRDLNSTVQDLANTLGVRALEQSSPFFSLTQESFNAAKGK